MKKHKEGFALASLLKECAKKKDIARGATIYSDIMNRGLLDNNPYLASSLINMFSRCGVLTHAKNVLKELTNPCVVAWNALVSGYSHHGLSHEAVHTFERMPNEGILPNGVSFICILKACGNIGDMKKGKEIHHKLRSRNLLDDDIVLGTALVDMYAKCGMLVKAHQVLEELRVRSAVTWNAIISRYIEQGQVYGAFNCFQQMQTEGISPNAVTFICILKACSLMGCIETGEKIQEEIVRRGMLLKEDNVMLGNTLVDMYVKCGAFTKAKKVLEELPMQNVVSWSVVMAGFAENKHCQEALDCLERMRIKGLEPDIVTFITILKVCGSIGAIKRGERIHEEIVASGLLLDNNNNNNSNIVLGTALVDMYAKCGMLRKAWLVLEELPARNVVSWSALIGGYAEIGRAQEALSCLEEMQIEGLSPSSTTLLCVLNACYRSGLFDKAQILFDNMSQIYGVNPELEHYTCMVMVFGCCGQFDKAIAVIQEAIMLLSDSSDLWLALLDACRRQGSVKLARLTFDRAIQLDDDNCGEVCLVMANVFGALGMQEDAQKVQVMRLNYLGQKEVKQIVMV